MRYPNKIVIEAGLRVGLPAAKRWRVRYRCLRVNFCRGRYPISTA